MDSSSPNPKSNPSLVGEAADGIEGKKGASVVQAKVEEKQSRKRSRSKESSGAVSAVAVTKSGSATNGSSLDKVRVMENGPDPSKGSLKASKPALSAEKLEQLRQRRERLKKWKEKQKEKEKEREKEKEEGNDKEKAPVRERALNLSVKKRKVGKASMMTSKSAFADDEEEDKAKPRSLGFFQSLKATMDDSEEQAKKSVQSEKQEKDSDGAEVDPLDAFMTGIERSGDVAEQDAGEIELKVEEKKEAVGVITLEEIDGMPGGEEGEEVEEEADGDAFREAFLESLRKKREEDEEKEKLAKERAMAEEEEDLRVARVTEDAETRKEGERAGLGLMENSDGGQAAVIAGFETDEPSALDVLKEKIRKKDLKVSLADYIQSSLLQKPLPNRYDRPWIIRR